MRNNYKLSVILKIVLIIVLIIFFLPLFILPFYNHACADDYICGYTVNKFSLLNYQKFIYNNWGGRFAATFTGSMFARNYFLYNHYYLHSILFLSLNILSSFFLLRLVHKYLLRDNLSIKNILLHSLIFVALTICAYPEFSTFDFWFSSSVTYQFPIVLFQFTIGFLLILFYTKNRFILVCFTILIPIFISLITAFNELFIVANAFLLFFIFFVDRSKKISRVFLRLAILLFFLSALIVVFSPGSQTRSKIIVPKSIYLFASAITFHMAEVLWNIFKNPFSWLVFFFIFYYAASKKNLFANNITIQFLKRKKWIFLSIILIFLLCAVSFAVLGLKGGLLPERYLNGVTYFTLILLILYSFIAGLQAENLFTFSFEENKKEIFIYTSLIIVLLCNTQIVDEYKSLLIAPTYDKILSAREQTLLHAANNPAKIATVKSYDLALQDEIKNNEGNTKTFNDLIQQKPKLLFFQDDLATDYSINILKKFYKLDSIIVKKN
ncbi:MAG: hypothetical protein ACR2FN_06145 [Chitinophagaceae bacterium]